MLGIKRFIIRILSYLLKYPTILYFNIKEQSLNNQSRIEKNLLSEILKIPIRIGFKIAMESIFYKYLPYSHWRMFSKGKYILSIKSTYSKKLEEIHYRILYPKFKIYFNEDEKSFLKQINTDSAFAFRFEKDRLNKRYKGVKEESSFRFQREVFSCVLRNVKFIGASGLVIHKNHALVESVSSFYQFRNEKLNYLSILKYRKMKGFFTSFMHKNYAYNYYHFIVDVLPRLHTILKMNEQKVNIIVPKNFKENYLDIIKLFLDERFKLVYIGSDEIWELEKYFFPSFCSNDYRCLGYIPKMYVDFVKDKIIESYKINKANSKNKRIYISRNKAKTRRLLNEDQLLKILKKYDFERVYMEDLSFKKQVKIFNSASIIIGICGAGLVNMIFSENLKVLELFPPKRIVTEYFMLSKVLGFMYRYVIGYDDEEIDGYDNDFDFRVNLTEVNKIIDEMIKI